MERCAFASGNDAVAVEAFDALPGLLVFLVEFGDGVEDLLLLGGSLQIPVGLVEAGELCEDPRSRVVGFGAFEDEFLVEAVDGANLVAGLDARQQTEGAFALAGGADAEA